MAVMTGTNRNRRRPETESAEEAEAPYLCVEDLVATRMSYHQQQ